MGGTKSTCLEEALLWVLSFSDGTHSLLDIAARSGVGFEHLEIAANLLLKHGLLSMD
jgi:aminopeptidase-like protein